MLAKLAAVVSMSSDPGSTLTAAMEGMVAAAGSGRLRLATGAPPAPSVLDLKEGDLVRVIQPDHTAEEFRVASVVPDGAYSVTLHFEPVS